MDKVSHTVSEWDEVMEYREWLNTPCCELCDPETTEDILQDELGEIRTGIEDLLDAQGMYNRNLIRRVTELEDELERVFEDSNDCGCGAKDVPEKTKRASKTDDKKEVFHDTWQTHNCGK